MPPIIEIQNLGKKYLVAEVQPYLSLREVISKKAKNIFSGNGQSSNEFWALQNISLQIEKGERIGIIGRNGAGKSTLLKILSKITPPTTGEIKLRGRVASLLEVGTGFHPELTGRENIYLNGSILGLSKKEIDRKLDAIIDFSGVEKFIDTPLKHYSSGMQLRLAFSVAAHLEPEILLIDEVLAVGDMEFQKKCIGKMEEVNKRDGRTILFVSHNMNYIHSFCNKAILLDNGGLITAGTVSEVVNRYISGIGKGSSSQLWSHNERPGNDVVKLCSVRLIDASHQANESFGTNQKVGIEMVYEVMQSGHILWLGHNIHNDKGLNIFDTHSVSSELYNNPHEKGVYTAVAWIPENLLNTGNYIVSTAIFNHLDGIIYLHEKDILFFSVHDPIGKETAKGMSPGIFPGVIRPLLKWSINKNQS
jgi:lipopolysaccharide transport system ATP-binding protein